MNVDGLKSYEAIAQAAAARTLEALLSNLKAMGIKVLRWTIGTSSVLICIKVGKHKRWLAFNLEGLGTKGLAADEIREMVGFAGYTPEQLDYIHRESGISAAAMSFNDLIVHGGVPFLYGQHVEFGDPDWTKDLIRATAITDGTAEACIESGGAWLLGETAQLEDVLFPGKASLSGASLGMVPKGRKPFDYRRMKPGDRILLLPSSGVHANGLTGIRKLVSNPEIDLQWDTKLPDGRLFGKAVLTPTRLYAPGVVALHEAGIRAIACHNITGGGFRRPLRYKLPWSYVINQLPPRPAEFEVIQKAAGWNDEQMYSAANNGTGFMIIVRAKDEDKACRALQLAGLPAWRGGEVVDHGDPHVELTELGIRYDTA